MRDAEVHPDVDLEELLDTEIPCMGIELAAARRNCARSAVLFSDIHRCPAAGMSGARQFKCVQCWQDWYKAALAEWPALGARCGGCNQFFSSLDAFSDYRPF